MLLWPFPHWCYRELGFMKLGPFTTPWFYNSPWEEGLTGWQPTDHILEESGWGFETTSWRSQAGALRPAVTGGSQAPRGLPTPCTRSPGLSPSCPRGPGLKTP